jgi:hypothetical protein
MEVAVRLYPRKATRLCRTPRGTPANRKSGELAHTSPYEGTHIVIFYDCVRKVRPKKFSVVLAHVMVHEVTHILQGICRHSASGVMKAQWDEEDF